MPIGSIPPIPVRETYRPTGIPAAYDPQWLRLQFGKIARAMWQPVSLTLLDDYTVNAADELLLCDATAGAFSVTLLPPAQMQFARITIKKIDVTANAITIVGTVDGTVDPQILTPMVSLTLHSDGVYWWIV